MTKSQIESVRAEIEKVLSENAGRFQVLGVSLKLGRGKYRSMGGANFDLEVGEVTEGIVKNKAYVDYIHHCSKHGLPENIIGKNFTHSDRTWKLVGMLPRRQTPCLVLGSDGRDYLFSVGTIKKCFNIV